MCCVVGDENYRGTGTVCTYSTTVTAPVVVEKQGAGKGGLCFLPNTEKPVYFGRTPSKGQ